MNLERPKALTIDVFGTFVDLSGSLGRQGDRLLQSWGIETNWQALAADWVAAYALMIQEVIDRRFPWDHVDALAFRGLEKTLQRAPQLQFSEAQKGELMAIWGSLEPWSDSIPGLARLRSDHLVFALSNGTVATTARIARHGGIPWDGIFSAGSVRAYKPDPLVYKMAIDALGLASGEILMVASHRYDLDGAKACGMATALVDRPQEPAGVGATLPDISCSSLKEYSGSKVAREARRPSLIALKYAIVFSNKLIASCGLAARAAFPSDLKPYNFTCFVKSLNLPVRKRMVG